MAANSKSSAARMAGEVKISARWRRNALVPSGRRNLAGVTVSSGGSSARQNGVDRELRDVLEELEASQPVLAIRNVFVARAASASRFHLVHVERRSATASTLTLASCCN